MPRPSTARLHRLNRASLGAIVVAAGDSSRMVGVDKMLVPLLGRPLIAYSLEALNASTLVDDIVLVMSRRNVEEARRLVEDGGWRKVSHVCEGGDLRQNSVRLGMDRLNRTEWTLVHDGARPCIDSDMIARGLQEAQLTGAAVAAVPIKDTVKAAGRDMTVTGTLDRDGLWAVQTPQIFRTSLLARAHREVSRQVTDDASMVEEIGGAVRLFMGSYANIKVTTRHEIPIAEAILGEKATGRTGLVQ